jgi:hypothetical protein
MPHTRGEKERGNEGIELGLLLGCYKVYVCVCAAVYIAPCSTVGREGKLAFDIMIGLLRYNCTILRVVYLATVEIETCQG